MRKKASGNGMDPLSKVRNVSGVNPGCVEPGTACVLCKSQPALGYHF